jgi:hypothetical protein
MPRICEPLIDAEGRVIGHVQRDGARLPCSTPGCRGFGSVLCDYPIIRGGKAGTCDRRCCRTCAVKVGPNRDHCGVHARNAGARDGRQVRQDFGAPSSLEGVSGRVASGTILTPKPRAR